MNTLLRSGVVGLWLLLTAGILMAQPPGTGNILYVDKNVNLSATGYTGSGSSWADAIPELSDALKWAKQNDTRWTTESPLKIYVAKGVYYPRYSPRDGAAFADEGRDNAFLMVKNVQLYGGFTGAEAAPGERDLVTSGNESILSGDLDLSGNLSVGDAYHVVLSIGNLGIARMDGFTITGALADGGTNNIKVGGVSVNKHDGGGWYNSGSDITMENMRITGNRATWGGGWYNNTGIRWSKIQP